MTGTFCDKMIQGTYRDKSKACRDCEFYQLLRREHGAAFSMPAFTVYLLERDASACDRFLRDNTPTGE